MLDASQSAYHERDDFLFIGGENVEVDLESDHEIVIVIKQLNLDKLESFVHEVSNPHSDIYGQYLTRAEVGRWTRNTAALEAVRSHLHIYGISDYEETLYGEYVTARASRRKWEEMFHAKFQPYRHLTSGNIVHRSVSYALHPSLEDHVMDVYHIRELPALSVSDHSFSKKVKAGEMVSLSTSASTAKEGYTTPTLLNSYYNIFTNQGNSFTSQTVYSGQGQYYSSTDIASFQDTFGIPDHPVDHDVNGRSNPALCKASPDNCLESNADLEYILAIAQNTPTSIM